jgi:hypothetical protein
MAELAKPNGASAASSQPAAAMARGYTSPYVALLIEVGVPLALVLLIAIVGASQRPFEISSDVEGLPTNDSPGALQTEPQVGWAENSLRVPPYDVDVAVFSPLFVGSAVAKSALGSIRFRLGDTVYIGQSLFLASVIDDRVVFKTSAPAGLPAPSRKRSEVSPKKSSDTVASLGPDSARLRLVGHVEPTPEAQRMNPAAQTAVPPQSQMPAPPPAKEQSPAKPDATMPPQFLAPNSAASPSPVPASNAARPAKSAGQTARPSTGTTPTTPEIVTGATMTALLQADAREITSVVIGRTRITTGLSEEASLEAATSAVMRLLDHLGSVTRIFILEHSVGLSRPTFRRILIHRSAWLWRLYATPLPLPGGTRLIEPQTINYKILPANLDSLVNPIYRVTPESTRLPVIAFPLIGFFALFAGRRRYAYAGHGISIRGFIDGAALAIGLVVTLAVLWHFWRWFPQNWMASASGLTCIALAAGALEGGLLAALHQAPRPSQTERDPALRTVLYRDTPVDDIAHDRLGFGPLVDALRRFLDNPATVPPVVLSVNGPWGSGKSSVMKMLSRELEKTGRFRLVWFNAWQYHREEQILAAFLQTIARQLSAQWGPVFALRLGWARWKDATLTRQLAVIAVLAIVVAGILRPDLRDNVASAIGSAAESDKYGAIVKLFLGGASIGTLGGILWAVNILWPFRLRLSHFFQATDQSSRVGYIDEFTREFRLYRQSVGNQKFLFLIDDLDRCQPDCVVDVLKAINLIITSTDEAGRSFFMLAYDQRYIVDAVEHHFVDLVKTVHEPGQRFGLQYLKKMVTLSVSVPRPSADQVQELLRRVDAELEPGPDSQQRDLPLSQRLRYASRKWARRTWRTAIDPNFARHAALAMGFFALALFLVMPRAATITPGTPSVAAGSSINPSPATSPASGRETIEMPSPTLPIDLFAGPLWWVIPALLLLCAAAALYVASRPALIEAAYRREPKDSAKFVAAVTWCKDLLPKNPRDAIRMVNLMRIEYLVQESDKAPLDGSPLDEWECVSLTILEKRHPTVFQKLLMQIDGPAASDTPDATNFSINGDPALARDVTALQTAGGNTSHIGSLDKMKRFVGVNRFLLEAEV